MYYIFATVCRFHRQLCVLLLSLFECLLAVCEIYKAKFPVICCSCVKNASGFLYLLKLATQILYWSSEERVFGEFWFWGSFQRNRWIRRKSCVIDPKKRQGIAAQLRGQGEARWLSCISFWRQAFWKTSRFSLRQKQEFTLLKYVES